MSSKFSTLPLELNSRIRQQSNRYSNSEKFGNLTRYIRREDHEAERLRRQLESAVVGSYCVEEAHTSQKARQDQSSAIFYLYYKQGY